MAGIERTPMDMRPSRGAVRRVIALVFAVLVSACSSSSAARSSAAPSGTAGTSAAAVPASSLAPIHGTYSPSIEPADFVTTIDNPYWPLKPGTAYHYQGVRGSTPQTDDEVVTRKTKQILGITCTVVRDNVSEQGVAVERTLDYYAQDTQGNVWYMGEDSFERRHGRMVRASDSWLSGVNGGEPGIIMPANPQPNEQYRQEYYPPGEALDEATVLRLDGSVTVPNGSYSGVLVTSEYSPLEPQTEQKYYAPGVGEVEETVVKGHHEEFQLVGITH
jgi:hypothetical protein